MIQNLKLRLLFIAIILEKYYQLAIVQLGFHISYLFTSFVYTSILKCKDTSLKKIIFFILLFSTPFLLANDTLNDFINEQIKIEAKLLDQNLSLEKKIDIKKTQGRQYQEFLLLYAADKEEHLQKNNPYRYKVSKLKLRDRKSVV